MQLWRLEGSKICRVGLWYSRGPREQLQFESKGNPLVEFLLAWGEVSLSLLRPSTDWMRPYIMEGNLLYSKSTDLNVSVIQKTQKHPECLTKNLGNMAQSR